MGVKIAVIDTGISNDEAINSICNVEHFYINDGKFVNGYVEPLEDHGTLCFEEILKQNIDFDIIDLNVSTGNGEITINNVVLGIQKAIDEKVDLINISLGFSDYCEEIFCICEKAVENNIVVISAASHTQEISYPASLKNVVSIDVNNNQTHIVEKKDDSTLFVRMDDKLFKENGQVYDLSSTSMASAYFTGLFAKQLTENPLLDKFVVLQKNYGLKYLDTSLDFIDKLEYKDMPLYESLKFRKTALILMPPNEGLIDDCIFNKVYAVYNVESKKFYDSNGKAVSDFDTILVVNYSQYNVEVPWELIKGFENVDVLFVGNFNCENNHGLDFKTMIYRHEDFSTTSLTNLSKPIIIIAGLSWDLGKFDLQRTLSKHFGDLNIKTKSVTYNMKGVLYGFDVFEYPQKIIFPDVVCELNNYMFCAESKDDFDCWFVNVGGGMFVNNFNKFSFGKLLEAYFCATDVDILILCIPTYVNFEDIERNIMKASCYGIKQILIVVSEYGFEDSSMHSANAIKTYRIDSSKYSSSVNDLKNNSIDINIFTIDDVRNGLLCDKILSLLA